VRKWPSYIKAFESYRITACKCMHLARCGHFAVLVCVWRATTKKRSSTFSIKKCTPEKILVTKMAVTPFEPPYPKTPCYTRQSYGAIFYRITVRYWRWKFTLRNINFLPFLLLTLTLTLTLWLSYTHKFIYELDPYCLEIHRKCKYELPTSRLLTDIQTD